MSTARRADPSALAEAVATALGGAAFVRLCARPTGDALAAAGLVARCLRERGVPFHVRTTRADAALAADEAGADDSPTDREDAADDATDGETALAFGWDAPDAVSVPSGGRPVSTVAAAAVDALGGDPDPLCGLAGVVAAGSIPGADGSGSLLEAAERRGSVERRPGVALAPADPGDGLAFSTLFRAPISGDPEAARALLAELDHPADPGEADRRDLASVVALDATTGAPARSVGAVERALRPYATPTGPFETLGGFADVLDAVARERPGLAVSLCLGSETARADTLDCWRSHARAAHAVFDDPTTARYDGAFVLRVDADPATVPSLATAARLARDFRSPEPVALVVARVRGDDEGSDDR
ncbi:hypothetical protein, partial [Candidatus Halobonum tyrrellensis]